MKLLYLIGQVVEIPMVPSILGGDSSGRVINEHGHQELNTARLKVGDEAFNTCWLGVLRKVGFPFGQVGNARVDGLCGCSEMSEDNV